MTTDRDLDLDRRLEDYLQSGPVELSDRVLWAARAQIHTTRRRRRLDWLAPWRTFQMTQSMRLLLAAGGALVVVAIGFGLLGTRQSGPGASVPPSPSPIASASSLAAATASPSATTPPTPTPSPSFVAPVVELGAVTEIHPAWAVSGAPKTTFSTPVVAPDGKIWVPANDLDRIRIYDPDTSKLLETWGTPGSGDGQFRFGGVGDRDRAGIVFAGDGSFFVLDSGNHRVERFSADRTFQASFGSYGTGDGQFQWPTSIGLDDGPNLYVGDGGRGDVQVFTTGGTYVRTVAKGAVGDAIWGSGPGWFITTRRTDDGPGAIEYHADGSVQGGWDLSPWGCRPFGVTRDQAPRNIYVTCQLEAGGTGYLFRFDQTGTLLDTWSATGRGVAVSPDGKRAFTVSANEQVLSRWDLNPPPFG